MEMVGHGMMHTALACKNDITRLKKSIAYVRSLSLDGECLQG